MRTTLKVAEMATILYAILVFGSLCIEMTYYAPFGISISSYLTPSEILLSFLNRPIMYLPSVLMLVLPYYIPGLRFDSSNMKRFRERETGFACYSFLIIAINILSVMLVAGFYKIEQSAGVFIFIFGLLLFLLLPNILKEVLLVGFIHAFKKILEVIKFNRFNKLKSVFRNTVSNIKIRRYRFAKHKVQMIDKLCANSSLYNIVISFVIILLGLCAVNYSRAYAYIDGEALMTTTATIITDDRTIECDNQTYIYVGESSAFIFVYDRSNAHSLVIPRGHVIQSTYSIPSENLKNSIVSAMQRLIK